MFKFKQIIKIHFKKIFWVFFFKGLRRVRGCRYQARKVTVHPGFPTDQAEKLEPVPDCLARRSGRSENPDGSGRVGTGLRHPDSEYGQKGDLFKIKGDSLFTC